jgi:Aspartyl protease
MKPAISRIYIRLRLAFSLAMISLPVLQAESLCPGNVASVTPRLVQRALIVIPVKINQKGPFDFMVDTGTQITVVDPSLASELALKSQGNIGLVAVASYSQASVAVLDTLEANSHVIEQSLAVVQDLGQIREADTRIRGVLGESFLAHFDLLIDYSHRLLCLDDTRLMQREVRGERIPLVTAKHSENDLPFTERLVLSVHLSDTGSRQILLQLDSGSDGPILYARKNETELPLLKRAALQGGDASNAQQAFALLPPQDMRIGGHTFRNVPFVTPVSSARNVPDREEDGLLPTMLFQRVYISFTNHYVIVDPRWDRRPRR